MKNSSYFLLPGLLVLAAACHKKDDDPAPSKAALLSAHAWKQAGTTLVINGYVGTNATTDNTILTFAADGKLLSARSGAAATQDGTWQLTKNDTQLVITPTQGSTSTFQVYELAATKLSYGFDYDQATITQQLAASGMQPVKMLILAASAYTFPATMPTLQPSQITSMQLKSSLEPG